MMIESEERFTGNGGQEIGGVLCSPDGAGPWPAVVVVHEVYGPTEYVLEAARSLGGEGFATLVPDLWSRERAAGGLPGEEAGLEEWTAFVEGIHHARIVGDLMAASRWLLDRPGVRGGALGTVGFSMGGVFAFHLACERGTPVRGCVDYYGRVRYAAPTPNHPKGPLDRVGELNGPLLGIFGAADPLVPLADVVALKERIAGRGHVIAYPRAGHSFMDPAGDSFSEEDAEDAWRRTLLFLRERIAPETLDADDGPAVPAAPPPPAAGGRGKGRGRGGGKGGSRGGRRGGRKPKRRA